MAILFCVSIVLLLVLQPPPPLLLLLPLAVIQVELGTRNGCEKFAKDLNWLPCSFVVFLLLGVATNLGKVFLAPKLAFPSIKPSLSIRATTTATTTTTFSPEMVDDNADRKSEQNLAHPLYLYDSNSNCKLVRRQ